MELFAKESRVFDVLARIHGNLAEIVVEAWSDFKKMEKAVSVIDDDRTIAGNVWFHCQRRMTEFAIEDGDILVVPRNNTTVFVIDGAVVLRFKKAGPKGMSRNVRTKAESPNAYNDPASQLPGIPALPRVDVLWTTDAVGQKIVGVYIQARNGDVPLWTYSIELPGAAQETEEIKPSTPDRAARRIAQPKVAANTKKSEGNA